MVDGLDIERVADNRHEEILLAFIEVIVGFESLQTVDQFLIGVSFGFQLVQVFVVVEDDGFDLLCIVLVHFLDLQQEIHDDLDVLDLFSGLDFAVIGQTVLVQEDGFGVFGHHYHSDLVLDELEVEFGVLQVFGVLLVPRQL